jgi:hypothetical protein
MFLTFQNILRTPKYQKKKYFLYLQNIPHSKYPGTFENLNLQMPQLYDPHLIVLRAL